MKQPLEAVLQADKDAEVRDLRDGALHHVARLVPLGDVGGPRVVGHLLQPQGDPPPLLVDRQHLALHLVALLQHLAGMGHLPRP